MVCMWDDSIMSIVDLVVIVCSESGHTLNSLRWCADAFFVGAVC